MEAIVLDNTDGAIEPFTTKHGGNRSEPEKDWLENILREFNERFGNMFDDPNSVFDRLQNDIAPKVANSESYQNARQNTPDNAPEEMKSVLDNVMTNTSRDDIALTRAYQDNSDFSNFLRKFVQQYIDRASNE